MRRYGVGGTSILLKALIDEGAYATAAGTIYTGSTSYWYFKVGTDYKVTLLGKTSNLGDPLVTSFGFF